MEFKTSLQQTASLVRPVFHPTILLRVEGLALFVAALAVYSYRGFNGWVFLALLFVPDVSMLGYGFGPRAGSVIYNSVHTTLLPLVLGVSGVLSGSPLALQLALVWLAHIGMDRTLGYGLKYASAFKDTHLTVIQSLPAEGKIRR
jgi:hypothetical protein